MPFVVVALLFSAAYQDPAPEDRWIADLAHDLVERRDQAVRELWKTGPAGLPAIRKALERGVHATDPKARKMLVDLERTIDESVLDAQRRLRALRLVTFEDRDYRLDEIVADLERQTGVRFKVEVDASLTVRPAGKHRPLGDLLDFIEEKLGVTIARPRKGMHEPCEIKPGRPTRTHRVHVPGATYNVRRGPPVVIDKLEGWVLETELADPAEAKIGSIEVLGPDGKAVPLIKCPGCSPARMFVRTTLNESVRVRFGGNVLWRSKYELKVDAVECPQRFQVGRYEILYEFLKTRVEPSLPDDEEWHPALTLSYKYKAGAYWQPKSATRGESRRFTKTHAAWCGKPVDVDAVGHMSWPITSSNWNEDGKIDPAELEGVRIFFSKPMKEPFEREIDLPPSK